MHSYLPHTKEDIKSMLDELNLNNINELFNDVDNNLKLKNTLDLPNRKSESELLKHIKQIGDKNRTTGDILSFTGGGVYDHLVPEIVNNLLSRSEFYTSYTPYQPEISQGTLQAIFEYQSMICELTGMDVSNASHYDGATAAAESALMACGATKRKKVIVSMSVNPQIRKVIKTYLTYKNIELIEIEDKAGVTDLEILNRKADKTVACVLVQSPNYFGILEDFTEVEKVIHQNKGLFITYSNPIALAVIKSPRQWGADIAVGEGQMLGNSLNYGGPYLGFMASTKKLMRKLPGRIVGQTKDLEGVRSFVLTLQAREQHIRRDKATSNITSNQGLNALATTIYLATLGKVGLKEVALRSMANAKYIVDEITKDSKYELAFSKPFFNEFVIKTPDSKQVIQKLYENNIIPGIDIGNDYRKYENNILIASTEKHNKSDLDMLNSSMREKVMM